MSLVFMYRLRGPVREEVNEQFIQTILLLQLDDGESVEVANIREYCTVVLCIVMQCDITITLSTVEWVHPLLLLNLQVSCGRCRLWIHLPISPV